MHPWSCTLDLLCRLTSNCCWGPAAVVPAGTSELASVLKAMGTRATALELEDMVRGAAGVRQSLGGGPKAAVPEQVLASPPWQSPQLYGGTVGVRRRAYRIPKLAVTWTASLALMVGPSYLSKGLALWPSLCGPHAAALQWHSAGSRLQYPQYLASCGRHALAC